MNCDRIQQLLPFLHDGSLEPAVKREVKSHLERCTRCAEAFDELSAIVNLTRNVLRARPVPVGSGYVGEVRERIRRRMQARSLYRWAVPAAAAMFLAVSVGTYSLFLEGSARGPLIMQSIIRGAWKYSATRTRTNLTASPSPAPVNTVTVDETALINAMYHYTDVTIDDLVSRMDENELATMLE